MDKFFPGTVIPQCGKRASEFLSGLFFATKGIMLSQMREITGLDTPVIQNWINRGWLPRPVDKRYSIDHLSRTMLINMLRNVMQLENIAALLVYINGVAGDTTDDAVPESALYCYVCNIIDNTSYEILLDDEKLGDVIEKAVEGYSEPFEGGYEKLTNGLKIIVSYYAAATLKNHGDELSDKFRIKESPAILNKQQTEA